MTRSFSWNGFLNGEFAIAFECDDEKLELLNRCEVAGLTGINGSPLYTTPFCCADYGLYVSNGEVIGDFVRRKTDHVLYREVLF